MVHGSATLIGTRVLPMLAGLPVALVFLAEAATAGPAVAAPQQPAPTGASAAADLRKCEEANKDPKATQIIVCAPKPQGYRIDPDVLAARRMKKKGDPGEPKSPHEAFADHSCATVGPMGCRGGPGFDVVTAAATAVTMVQKAVKGENAGKELVTDPQRNEYSLYLEAKKQREAKEAEAAAKKAQAAAAARTVPAPQQ